MKYNIKEVRQVSIGKEKFNKSNIVKDMLKCYQFVCCIL